MLNYILVQNKLVHGEDAATGYHAQTVQSEDRSTADFIKVMAELKGGATEGEAAQWLDILRRAIVSELSRGCNVNIKGVLNAGVNIKGSFPDSQASFDPSVNTLHVSMTASREIIKALRGISTSHVSEASSGIFIGHVQDAASGTEDIMLTPSMVCRVFGRKIKLAGNNASVGIYLVDDTGNALKVDDTAISHNSDKEIDFVIPALVPGNYQIKVITMSSGGKTLLAAARSYTFAEILTVES
ncbi:DUF4469 domain-containing protein [Breznakiellaceae bacterium SP9]